MPLAASLLADLAAMPDRAAALLGLVPAGGVDWVPGDWEAVPGERFTVRGQLCHLRDIEVLGYHVRLRRMAEEVAPDLDSLDSYALAEARGYGGSDPWQALDAFRRARAETVARIGTLTEADLARTGTFAEYGRLSLQGLLHLLASHDAQHLACLHWLLTRMSAAPIG